MLVGRKFERFACPGPPTNILTIQRPSFFGKRIDAVSRFAVLLFGAVLLAGCSGKSPQNASSFAQFPLPKKWSAKTIIQPEYNPDPCWILDFNDSNLCTFVGEALKNNRSIKSAASRIELAATEARLLGADLYPNFEINFDGSRRKQNFIGLPIPGNQGNVLSTHNNQFGLTLDISWEIDLWGRIRAAQSAAIAEMEATQYDSRPWNCPSPLKP